MGSSGLGLLTTIIINGTVWPTQLLAVPLLISLVLDYVQLTDLPLWRSFGTIVETAGLMIGGPASSRIVAAADWHL